MGGPLLTAGELTGDPIILEVEAALQKMEPTFGGAMVRQLRSAMNATTTAIRLLRGTGDPQAIRTAAELRQQQMDLSLETMDEEAKTVMQRAAEGLSPDRPQDMAQFSRASTTILEETIDRAGVIEEELWTRVPDGILDIRDGFAQTLAAYDTARAQLPQQATIHPFVEQVIGDMRKAVAVMARLAAGEAADISQKDVAMATRQLSIQEMI